MLQPALQGALVRKRISTRPSLLLQGREQAFVAWTPDGSQYACKDDNSGRPVRATEWIFTTLYAQLGIATAACEILESDDGSETFFGSLYIDSVANRFELQAYLVQPSRDELGRPTGWLNRYLSQLYALDMLIHNDDRSIENFLLAGQVLYAIDFAAGNLAALRSVRFPVASCATVSIGKRLRAIHGFDLAAALEMIERVGSLPANVIEGIMGLLPADWLDDELKREVVGLWQNRQLERRLDALRLGLTDGTLL